MKRLMNKWFLTIFVVALAVSFMYLPTLSAFDQESRNAEDSFFKREKNRLHLQALQEEIKLKGYSFTVDFNPAMQYDLSEICAYDPDLAPEMTYAEAPLTTDFAEKGKPGGGGGLPASYMAQYTSVKNQGSCGACWAFALAGAMEGAILKSGGGNTDLSEQFQVSCNPWGWGCNGGRLSFDMFVSPGAVLEKCYHYSAQDTPCKLGCAYPYQAQSWSRASSTDTMKQAIMDHGGVATGIYADYYFQAYNSGVFDRNVKGAKANHAVVIVGWDDSKGSGGAWRIKNSWGNGWGESGMMWIEYGCMKVGESACYVVY